MKKLKKIPYFKAPQIYSFRKLISYVNEEYREKTAFSYFLGDKLYQHTYAELVQDVKGLATALLEKGYKKGDKIAVIGKNSYLWVVSYLATMCSGNIVVPLDKDLSEETHKKLLKDCSAKAIIYDDDYTYFEGSKDFDALPMRKRVTRMISKGIDMYKEDSKLYDAVEVDSKTTAAIIYTSGTTGVPKGVMLSQNSIVLNGVHGNEFIALKGSTVLLLPLHHTYAICCSLLCPMISGTRIHINSNLKNVLKDIQTAKPYYLAVVPLYVESFLKSIWSSAKKSGKEEILKNLVKHSNRLRKMGFDMRKTLFKSVNKAFGGKLEIIVSGGAPAPLYVFEEFDNFGIKILEGYGITECSPGVAFNRAEQRKIGSVGQVIRNNEVKIFDMDDNGEGEICVRGDAVMLGYYNNKKATDEVLEDGWFATGDIGYLDDDGFLYITGRKKNLIITATGKNIHPEELEELITTNVDGILEIIVSGDEKYIYAEVFRDPDKKNISEEDIKKGIDEFNKTLPVYKRINQVTFRDTEFEKTTTKKIKRH